MKFFSECKILVAQVPALYLEIFPKKIFSHSVLSLSLLKKTLRRDSGVNHCRKSENLNNMIIDSDN
jgi:hypothetical protein